MSAGEHVTDWLPAYVLHCLTDEEMALVAKHLASCPACQAELHSYQAAADELPLALVQTAPPPALKDRLMQEIRSRQMKDPDPSAMSFWPRLAAFFRRTAPAWSLVVILLLAVVNVSLWNRLNQVNSHSATTMRMIPLVNSIDSPAAVGALIMDPGGIYGTLVVDSLPALDSTRQYQVWLVRDGARTSGGVFSVHSDGYASLEILAPLPLIQYDSIGITIESAGGNPAPTGSKILAGDLHP